MLYKWTICVLYIGYWLASVSYFNIRVKCFMLVEEDTLIKGLYKKKKIQKHKLVQK